MQIANTIFRLLPGATSLPVVREFLKNKGLASSAGSWDAMCHSRLMPALHAGHIALSDLRQILRDGEECGRQHVFLYQCSPDRAAVMLAADRLNAVLQESGLIGLLEEPLDLELPESPTIVDIRRIQESCPGDGDSILIKQVETRTRRVFLGEQFDPQSNRVSRVYAQEKKRAVNIARLYRCGLLEIRIASQDNSTRYQGNVAAFFSALRVVFDRSEFVEVTLSVAKRKLWNDEERLKDIIRYSQSTAKNDRGFAMSVSSTLPDDDISDDDGSTSALHQFLSKAGEIVSTNIYFKIPNSSPAREVHVLIGGDANEFAIPVACAAEDHDYVRRTIQSLNTRASA